MGMKHTNFPCVICWNRRKTALLVKTRGAAPLPAGSRLSHTGIASGFPTGGSSPSACRSMVISIIHQTCRSSNCLSESYTKKTRFFIFPAVCPLCGHMGGFSFSLDLYFPVWYPVSMRHTTTNGRRLHPLFSSGISFWDCPQSMIRG